MPATMLRVWPIRARGRDRPAMGMDWHTFQVPPYVGLGIRAGDGDGAVRVDNENEMYAMRCSPHMKPIASLVLPRTEGGFC